MEGFDAILCFCVLGHPTLMVAACLCVSSLGEASEPCFAHCPLAIYTDNKLLLHSNGCSVPPCFFISEKLPRGNYVDIGQLGWMSMVTVKVDTSIQITVPFLILFQCRPDQLLKSIS